MNIAEKVERKMAALEHLMNTQMHLVVPLAVAESMDVLAMYVERLTDEDKDYIDCASDALKSKRKWEV